MEIDDPIPTFALLREEREPWRLRAACRGMGVAAFFPVHLSGYHGQRGVRPELDGAAVCAGCPVGAECAATAGTIELVDGIWNGVEYRRGKPR